MRRIDTVVIGGGQAGLAMSRCLSDAGVEHVVLERGRVGERWRSERWDSLHLLTPRWQSRLPGWSYAGPDPDGYMRRDELVTFLEGYASSFPVPLYTGVTVTAVERAAVGYRVGTDSGKWMADNVVIATGECDTPLVPPFAGRLSRRLDQVVPTRYRNPGQLRPGGVLVVGASATGIQLAAEIHRSGRPVTLAVGRHTRLPRMYRGRDILWWLDTMGITGQRIEEVQDPAASMDQPSMQLIGSPDRQKLDLNVLHGDGVRVVGRIRDAVGDQVSLDDDLAETTAAADFKLARLRIRIDERIRTAGAAGEFGPEEEFVPVRLPDGPPVLDLRTHRIETVLWATGFRRSYPWLRVPVLGANGEIRHAGGVTPLDGLYVLGLNFLRRRNSTFIDGVGQDARELTDHLLSRRARLSLGVA
jgi:putative flavoprotein involved in K+ transport